VSRYVDEHRGLGVEPICRHLGRVGVRLLAAPQRPQSARNPRSQAARQARSQLELAVVEYIGLYNAARLHESLGDNPPVEYDQQHVDREATTLIGATV
jgi:transposase InsO family protein